MPTPRLDDQLCFRLYTASRLVQRAYKPLLHEIGLTYPQYLVMMVLWERADEDSEPLTVSALGKRLRLDSGTLTPLLKRLEKSGFVTRQRSTEDERVVQIAVTDNGRALAVDAARIPGELLCRYEGSSEPLFALIRNLDVLLATLEA